MQCRACGTDNRTGRRFCSACGAPLGIACRACGAANGPEDRFCGECGAALEFAQPPPARQQPTGEMRPVTVLFCDLTGYTALAARLEPERTAAILDAFFAAADAAVASRGGTVDKHIGDCVMALFGAPLAHADDAWRAAAAAIDIREAVARFAADQGRPELDTHAGLAEGVVMAATFGSELRRDYTVIGPSVNLAARLCDAARAGEILITDSLGRTIEARFELEPCGAMQLDGVAEPVSACRLLAARTGEARAAVPLIGRQREMRHLTSLLEDCVANRLGQVIYLRGQAGIGKSRLAEAFDEYARAAGAAVAKAAVLDFGGGRRQDAARELSEGLLGLSSGASDVAVTDAVGALVGAGVLADEERATCAELLDRPVPPDLAELAALLAPDVRRQRRAAVLGRLAAAAAARRPLCLIVEDVHWADAETLAGLAGVAGDLAGAPAVMLLTGRPDNDPIDHLWRAAIGATPLATIDLSPLGEEAALELATVLHATDPLRLGDIVRRAEGNPLFLVQLIHHVGDRGREALPTSIRSLVFARLDRLAPVDKHALQVAAVLGDRFESNDLRALLAADYEPSPLVAAHLLKPDGTALRFAHALIREAVYDSLPASRRSALHGKAAAIVAERDRHLHAEHLERAGDPAAAAVFLQLATEELVRGTSSRALSLANRGLGAAGDASDRFALTEKRGEILLASGEVAAADAAFLEALEIAPDDAARCRAKIGRAQCQRVTDDLVEAAATLAQAEARAEAGGLLLERAQIHHLRGNLLFPQGRFDECLAEHKLALALAREAGSVEAEIAALGGLGDAAYTVGLMRSARDMFERCVRLAREAGLGRVAIANAPMLAILCFLDGEPAEAERIAGETLEAARRAGAVRPEMICRHVRFLLAVEAGDWQRARAEIERANEIAVGLGATRFQAENSAFLAWALRGEGRREAAIELARHGRTLAETGAGRSYMLPVVLGQIAAASDNEAEREAAVGEACEILDAGAMAHCYLFFYRALIEADALCGRSERAKDWASALEAAVAAEPTAWSGYVADWARAMAGLTDEGGVATAVALADVGKRIGMSQLAGILEASVARIGDDLQR